MSGEVDGAESVPDRIDRVATAIETRLQPSVVGGKVDLDLLKDNDEELHHILRSYAESKTVRDDPVLSARDVAKLLEAQSATTPLGSALARFAINKGE